MRKRNPMARDLRVNPLYRPRKDKSLRDQEGRADRWSRAALDRCVYGRNHHDASNQ
jgi:hypothetical protein